MSVLSTLRRIRAILLTGIALRAFLWGGTVAIAAWVLVALLDLARPLPLSVRLGLATIAVLLAASVTAALLWRDRTVLSIANVALWIEERFPSLEYTLITEVESGGTTRAAAADGERWTSRAARGAARVIGAPAAALVVAALLMLVLPGGAIARARNPRAGDALERGTRGRAPAGNRLTPLVATVQPPAYSGQPSSTVDEPSDVRALVGSVLTLRGTGSGVGIVARSATDSLTATDANGRWSIRLAVPTRPLALTLADRGYRRVIAIEPIVDNPPVVVLAAPAHDSVLRTPAGRIRLLANANDDFGIAAASFEYIVSSGEGETFNFRSGTLGAIRPTGREASLSASLLLDSLALKPGDIVHLRAVARDANTVTGPGVGVSETRTIRIARADEYDSVAVDAVPPTEAEKGAISERMLIMLAEALVKKQPSLEHDAVVGESRSIAVDQKKLRRAVGDIVFTRLGNDAAGEEHSDDDTPERARTMEALLARADSATNRSADALDFEGGETPVVAINKPLLEAYNAMWDATTSLEIGEPAKALPHMRRALAAIQRARQAERLYLRGTPPAVVIDLDKARLKGKDKGSSSSRRASTSADSAAHARGERFARVVELAAHDPAAAADSLLLLRIDALADNAPFAAAAGDAAAAIKRGKSAEATTALARARRALAGAAVSRDSLTRWSIVP